MSVATIRDGLKTRLATISGLRAHDVWPDTVNTPAAIVRPDRREFALSMGSSPAAANALYFVVTLYAASTENGLARAQEAADAYLDDSGASSIKAAIETDKTLSGTATTCRVVRWYDYDTYQVGDIEYLGVRFEVEVWP